MPSATWRMLYKGIQPSKSTTTQVSDSSGMLEAFAVVDVDLVDKAPDPKGFRLSEERPFFEAMNQDIAETLFYGNTAVNPERFTGLTPRYSALSTDTTKIGYNVLDAGGTDNLASIWLVTWGPSTTHMFYPRGSQAGLKSEDLGVDTVYDGDGNPFRAYQSHYKWDTGLSVRDWRANVRIANIDITKISDPEGAEFIDLNALLIQAMHRVKGRNLGRAAFYANTEVITALDLATWRKANLHLTYKDVQGETVLTFRGIPIRECDALLNTEEQVTA